MSNELDTNTEQKVCSVAREVGWKAPGLGISGSRHVALHAGCKVASLGAD